MQVGCGSIYPPPEIGIETLAQKSLESKLVLFVDQLTKAQNPSELVVLIKIK